MAICVPAVCIPTAVKATRETRVGIGTGKTATPEQAEEACEHIRTVIRKLYVAKIARATSLVPEKFVKISEDQE